MKELWNGASAPAEYDEVPPVDRLEPQDSRARNGNQSNP